MAARDFRELDDLLGPRVKRGDIEQTGGETKRSLPHRGIDESAHMVQLSGVRLPILQAEHATPNPAVSSEEANVRCYIQRRGIGVQRPRLVTAMQRGQDRRDPLAQKVFSQWVAMNRRRDMRMIVDEAWRNDHAVGSEDDSCIGRVDGSPPAAAGDTYNTPV